MNSANPETIFSSPLQFQVLGRESKRQLKGNFTFIHFGESGWDIIGTTPSQVTIPEGYDIQINLGYSKASKQHLEELTSLEQLSHLNLERNHGLSDADFSHVAKYKNLRYLSLRESSGFTDAVLSNCLLLQKLKILDLKGYGNLTDNGLELISRMYSLEELDLFMCGKITSAGLSKLGQLESLEHLRTPNIDDTVLQIFSQLSKLRTLSISGELTDKGMSYLRYLGHLESLSIEAKDVGDEGLLSLRFLPKLKMLAFESCREITDQGIAQLEHVPSLESLVLRYLPNVTGSGLKSLSTLRNLKKLHLFRCASLNDDAVRTIMGLPNLQSLYITDEISPEGIQRILNSGLDISIAGYRSVEDYVK